VTVEDKLRDTEPVNDTLSVVLSVVVKGCVAEVERERVSVCVARCEGVGVTVCELEVEVEKVNV